MCTLLVPFLLVSFLLGVACQDAADTQEEYSTQILTQKDIAGEVDIMQRDLRSTNDGCLNPFKSCWQITEACPSAKSGYYWVQNGTGQEVEVYCDMDSHCCNSTRGWMRVANVNMADPTQQCPPEFTFKTENGVRVCGRDNGSIGCTSTTFSSHGIEYGRVCGRIRAYQFGNPNAFEDGQHSIDDHYVDGISITHGSSPRKHIWTFAAALSEFHSNKWTCPCTKTDQAYAGIVPPYIGNDYFCDTAANASARYPGLLFYPDDPLWDGQGCGPTSSCCSFNNPPWFCIQLPQPTTDDIELRMCGHLAESNEDSPFDQIELYVQSEDGNGNESLSSRVDSLCSKTNSLTLTATHTSPSSSQDPPTILPPSSSQPIPTTLPSSSQPTLTTLPSSSQHPPTTSPSSSQGPPTTSPSSSQCPPTTSPSSSQRPPTTSPSSSQRPPTTSPSSSQRPPTTSPSSSQRPPTTSPSPSQLVLIISIVVGILGSGVIILAATLFLFMCFSHGKRYAYEVNGKTEAVEMDRSEEYVVPCEFTPTAHSEANGTLSSVPRNVFDSSVSTSQAAQNTEALTQDHVLGAGVQTSDGADANEVKYADYTQDNN